MDEDNDDVNNPGSRIAVKQISMKFNRLATGYRPEGNQTEHKRPNASLPEITYYLNLTNK
jgi:hypothetical protein